MPKKTVKKESNFTEKDSNLETKSLEYVNSQIEKLVSKVESLEVRMKNLEQTNVIKPKTTNTIMSSHIIELLHKNYDLIDYNTDKNGLVPISLLWDKMQKHGVSWNQFENELLSLESNGLIELHSAKIKNNEQDETKVLHNAKGEIFYLIKWRSN